MIVIDSRENDQQPFVFCRALPSLQSSHNFRCKRFKLPSRKSKCHQVVGAEVDEQRCGEGRLVDATVQERCVRQVVPISFTCGRTGCPASWVTTSDHGNSRARAFASGSFSRSRTARIAWSSPSVQAGPPVADQHCTLRRHLARPSPHPVHCPVSPACESWIRRLAG